MLHSTPRQLDLLLTQLNLPLRQLNPPLGQIYMYGYSYDLMSGKYITSLLLIKMLKAFIKVNIKYPHLLTYVFLLTLLQVYSDALRQLHMPPRWLHSTI